MNFNHVNVTHRLHSQKKHKIENFYPTWEHNLGISQSLKKFEILSKRNYLQCIHYHKTS